MDNNTWNDLGDQIKDAVDSAVHSGNFQDLSRSIGDLVNTTIDSVKTNINQTIRSTTGWSAGTAASAQKETLPDLYTKHPPGKASGVLYTAVGFALMGTSLAGVIGFLILFLLTHNFGTALIIFIVLSVLGLGIGLKGLKKLSFMTRFHKYIRQIQHRMYIPIRELADKCGKTLEFTTKDLMRMIQMRMFYEAHVDGAYLILSDDAYQEYQIAKKDSQTRQEIERKQQAQTPSAECQKLIEDGEKYISYIHTCNDLIPDEEITNKLNRMEQVTRRIFDEVRQHPQAAPQLQKMMDYYLPTTTKLLDAYRDLDAQPVAGDNITSTKKEISDTLDTLNNAFEKLLDSLFTDRAWDITSDISVLNTMLAQDGLTEDHFSN